MAGFGGFGSSGFGAPASPSPFGQSTPAFGAAAASPFGAQQASPFGASPGAGAFGQPTTPSFGAAPAPSFGVTGFGAAPAAPGGFGSQSGFGAKPAGSGFGTFGSTPSATPFGAASASAFGASSAPAFGAAPTSAFGASPNPSPFGGQLMSQPAFGAASSAAGFGSTGATPAFGAAPAGFGGAPGFGSAPSAATGTRAVPYQKTQEQDSSTSSGLQRVTYVSINAMPQYSGKSLDELRWEDYQAGCKGNTGATNPSPFGASPGFGGAAASPFGGTSSFGASQSSPFGGASSAPAFGAASTNAFGVSSTPAFGAGGVSPFGAGSVPAFGTAQPATQFGAMSAPAFGSSPFGASAAPAFGANSASGFGATAAPSFGAASTSAFGASPAPAFGSASTPAFGASAGAFGAAGGPSIFGTSAPAMGQQGLTSSSPFGATSAPAFGASPSVFGATSSTPAFGGGSLFGASASSVPSVFGAATTPAFGGQQPATGGGLFGAGASQSAFGATTPPLGTAFGQSSPGLFGGASAFNKTPGNAAFPSVAGGAFGFAQPAGSPFGGQSAVPQAATPPGIAQSPYGALPEAPAIANGTPAPAMKVGISQQPLGGTSILTARSIITPRTITPRSGVRSRPRRVATAAHRAHTAASSPALLLCNNGASPGGSLFTPRENPRRLFIREAPPSTSMSTATTKGRVHTSSLAQETEPDQVSPPSASPAAPARSRVLPSPIIQVASAGDGNLSNGNGDDKMSSQLPVLKRSDYYTEPSLDALKSNLQADAAALSRVHGFTVGRHGFGSVKWVQPVDVRGLDLDVLVQIRFKELEVYPEGVNKPPIGQGLNGPAMITLLKVFKIDKSTGKPTSDEAAIKKFRRRLIEHTAQMQSKFVSYDPDTGEWIFEVGHFSKYGLDSSDEDSDGLTDVDQGSDDELQLLGVASLIPGRGASCLTAQIIGEHNVDEEDAVMHQAEPNELHVTRRLIAQLGNSVEMATEDGEETADDLEARLGDTIHHEQALHARCNDGPVNSPALLHSLPAALQLEATELAEMHTCLELQNKHSGYRSDSLWPRESASLSTTCTRRSRNSWTLRGCPLSSPQADWSTSAGDSPLRLTSWTAGVSTANAVGTPGSKAITELHTTVDAALLLGKSFRVGWGPNGMLAVPFITPTPSSKISPHAVVSLQQVSARCSHVLMAGKPPDTVDRARTRLVKALSAHSHFSVAVSGVQSEIPARVLVCQRERGSLSEVCNEFNQVAIEAHNNTASKLEKMIAAHEMGAWQLVLELFATIDVGDADGDTGQLEALRRRAAVSDLLRQLTQSTVHAAVSIAPDLLAVVMAWLTGHDVGSAIAAAASAGDVRLATLIASAAAKGGSAVHEPLQAQLGIWAAEGFDGSICKQRLALYNLLSGRVSEAGSDLGLDWRRSLGLYLWYGFAPTAGLDDVLKEFQAEFSNGRAAKPQPAYLGSAEAPSGLISHHDTWFSLLCLEAGSSISGTEFTLERVLHPSGHTPDPLDHIFVWQLAGVLLGLNTFQTSGISKQHTEILYRLNAAVVAQAELLNEPLWAIYAACHIQDHPLCPGMRDRAVRDILERHAHCILTGESSPSNAETWLCNELQLPRAWLDEAKAMWAKYTWQHEIQAEELIAAEQWAAAHDIVLHHVAPKLFLDGEHEVLSILLERLHPHAAAIDRWGYGAGLFSDFYYLQHSCEPGLHVKAAALQTALSNVPFDTQLSTTDLSLHLCLARMAQTCWAWVRESPEAQSSSLVPDRKDLILCKPPLSLQQQGLYIQHAAASISSSLS